VSDTLINLTCFHKPKPFERGNIFHQIVAAVRTVFDSPCLEKTIQLILRFETKEPLQGVTGDRIPAIRADCRILDESPRKLTLVMCHQSRELIGNFHQDSHTASLHLERLRFVTTPATPSPDTASNHAEAPSCS
jgi:hypothetical protein